MGLALGVQLRSGPPARALRPRPGAMRRGARPQSRRADAPTRPPSRRAWHAWSDRRRAYWSRKARVPRIRANIAMGGSSLSEFPGNAQRAKPNILRLRNARDATRKRMTAGGMTKPALREHDELGAAAAVVCSTGSMPPPPHEAAGYR